MNFEALEQELRRHPQRAAVAGAADPHILQAMSKAAAAGFARPILIGRRDRMLEIAEEYGIDLRGCEIQNAEDAQQTAKQAAQLVRDGSAQALVKGALPSAVLLRAILKRENGLISSGLLSHVTLLQHPPTGRSCLVTDAALVISPDLRRKAQLIRNAVCAAHQLGIENPKVAVIAAIETVNPAMPCTVDAQKLVRMNEKGEISGCTVAGPLALDDAISPEAARAKGIDSPVAGHADILLMPEIESANVLVKAAVGLGGCQAAGVVVGARAPIALSSRADPEPVRLASLACALFLAQSALTETF